MAKFLLSIVGTGLILTVMAVLFERLLILGGFVRGDTIFLAVILFLMAVVMIFIQYGKFSLLDALVIVIIGPTAMNRIDLAKTMYKGRWWWKSEDETKN